MNMSMDCIASITVQYAFRDGWHVFTSEEVEGFYVASKNPEEAFADVAPTIALLMKLNEGVDVALEPVCTLNEFLARVRGEDSHVVPDSLKNTRYAVRPAA